MIEFPHSMCKSPLGGVRVVASGTDHQGSTRGRVEVTKNCPCLGDTSTRSPQSFYLVYHNEH
jgi:hypothetical protein